MKRRSSTTITKAMKLWTMAALLALGCTGAGCTPEPQLELEATSASTLEAASASVGDEAQVESLSQEVGGCCSYGSYTCPTNPEISFDYDTPGCGLTKPRAQQLCRSQCGRACVDSGWQDGCN